MPRKIDIGIQFKELGAQFDALTKDMNKVFRKRTKNELLKPVAVSFRKAAKAAAPVHRGNLKRSMAYRKRTTKNSVYYVIGGRWPKGAHGHLIERGTQPRYTSAGAFRGAVKPTKFFSNAIEAAAPREASELAGRMRAVCSKNFEEFAAKAAAKKARRKR